MKAGVSTASLFTRKNNEDALPLLESLGIKTVEVFLTSFSEYGYPFAEPLKERKGSLQVNSVHDLNTQFEPQLFNAHPRVKADAYTLLDKVLDSANALSAPYYTFHGTSRVKRSTHSGKYDDFPRMIEGFAELTAYCKARGVTLCLENVEWSTYNRPGVFGILSREIPDLCGVLDIKQARISEFPYEEYIKDMGGKIKYVHVSDFGDKGMCLPGQGKFNFNELLRRLTGEGFDGALIIEVYQGDYREPIELKRSCEYLEELMDKYQ